MKDEMLAKDMRCWSYETFFLRVSCLDVDDPMLADRRSGLACLF